MFGGKKSKRATQADPHKWDDLSQGNRQTQSSLPNRLQKSLEWWGKSALFKGGAGYRESDPKVYRFAAKTLDAAGYSFLQIARTSDGKTVTDQYGGLVDTHTKKRSFAIEPLFTRDGVGGHEQQKHRADGLNFQGTTFPDLVVQKRDHKVAVELKVPKTYAFTTPAQALKTLVEGGEVGKSDPFFQKEFSRRKEIMGGGYEQRLLVDLNTSGLSKKDALAYFKQQAGENGDKFAFDTLQFIHRKGGELRLSSTYNAADGFASKQKEAKLNLHKTENGFSNFFKAPSATPGGPSLHTSPGTSAPPRDASPGPLPMQPLPHSPATPQVEPDLAIEKKRKRADSAASHDNPPSSPPRTPPLQTISNLSTAPTPQLVSTPFPPIPVPSPTLQQPPSPTIERRPTKQAKVGSNQPAPAKLDGRTKAGKLQAAANSVKGTMKPMSSFFGKK